MKPLLNVTKKHQKGLTLALSALLPMAIMLVVWAVMGAFPFGEKTQMAVDFGQQYISFYGLLKEAVLSGDLSSLFYSFTKSIGGDMIGVLAYYLMSPFNLFYIFVPLHHYAWAVFLSIWLRYGAIGLSFAYFLYKRHRGQGNQVWLIPLMATSYTLSGMLVSYQMNVIFYDGMIMLPLVIGSLEAALDGRRRLRYLWVLALTIFLQFYMGYMIAIFVALYACYYVSPRLSGKLPLRERLGDFFKPLFQVLGISILGAGTTAALLYPVILNLMTSKQQVGGGMAFSWELQINPLDILSKLILGGFDNESGWSAGPNLPNIYVGALALIGFILYFFYAKVHRNQKIAAFAISLIFFISMINEFVSKIWHMGQNPAGFFYRFSWIFSFFMIVLAYEAIKANPKLTWKGLIPAGLIMAGVAYYIQTNDFTYIAKEQAESLTTFAQGNRLLVYAWMLSLAILLCLLVWTRLQDTRQQIFAIILLALAMPTVFVLLFKGYLMTQLSLTLLTWILVVLAFFFKPGQIWWIFLTMMTVFELGYNAYMSQNTLGYAEAGKFSDAATSVKEVTDYIQDNTDSNFYRIATTFAYSKTTPSLIGYPGLSSFSSSLETATIDLFSSMGDVGVNAATQYVNGTALTDALYGVRYYVDVKPYSQEDVDANPKTNYFAKMTHRSDIAQTYTKKVYENDRYIVYENPNVFSAGFATNQATRNISFGLNNPLSNQNLILTSMSGQEKEYFKLYQFEEISHENFKEKEVNGVKLYDRINKDLPGIVRFSFTPQSANTYYFLAPYATQVSASKNWSALLNNQWLNNQKTYAQRQMWQVAYNQQGQKVTVELRFTADDINLTGVGMVRADNTAIAQVINGRLAQNMTVTKWTNTSIDGEIEVTDDSDVLMTSIPYSNGWRVWVDDQEVEITKAWNSLISVPISSGKHKITMIFVPAGLYTGLAISAVFLVLIFLCWNKEWLK